MCARGARGEKLCCFPSGRGLWVAHICTRQGRAADGGGRALLRGLLETRRPVAHPRAARRRGAARDARCPQRRPGAACGESEGRMPARFHVSQSRWRDVFRRDQESHRRSHMSASAGAEGREAEARDVIVESVCGQLWGLRHAKLAVLLALIGGVSRRVRAPWPPCRRPPRVPQGGRRLHVGDTRDAFAAAKEGRLRRPLAPQTCTLRRPLRLSPVRRNDCSNDTCVASRVRILTVAAALSPAPPKRRWSGPETNVTELSFMAAALSPAPPASCSAPPLPAVDVRPTALARPAAPRPLGGPRSSLPGVSSSRPPACLFLVLRGAGYPLASARPASL